MRGGEITLRRRSRSLSSVPLKEFSKSHSTSVTRCKRSSREIRLLSPSNDGDVPTELVPISTSSRKQRRRSSCDFSEKYLYYEDEADKENIPHLLVAKPITISKAEGRRRTFSCDSYDLDKEKFQPSVATSDDHTPKSELVTIKAEVLFLPDSQVCIIL